MLGEHHDLLHEFPEFRDQIHALKVSNGHFARLFDEYHQLDRQIRRIEQQVEIVPDEEAETLKKRRLQLKDELYRMLRQAAA
ncbi:conserved hypothetical protein [Methylomarinovum tepidoasis]|uniref:GTP-binding protein n=1 Tax=Methylomarinovum tepidoasis TaxID=2840183 RepID=A0AAU9D3R5_9GAMM|nr:YdcH family protein [Methylomarinovum sp. IN45]BCX89619.1 conserved hypothetical protein [Methylomarinovum sp. IN45]